MKYQKGEALSFFTCLLLVLAFQLLVIEPVVVNKTIPVEQISPSKVHE